MLDFGQNALGDVCVMVDGLDADVTAKEVEWTAKHDSTTNWQFARMHGREDAGPSHGAWRLRLPKRRGPRPIMTLRMFMKLLSVNSARFPCLHHMAGCIGVPLG